MKNYWIIAVLFLIAGCQEPLRFAPSQAQKQTAELTQALAVKVRAEGTHPASPISQKIAQGTQVALSYIGRPKSPPNAEIFDFAASQAAQDAIQRPDPWTVADNLLELGIGIASLVGGAYGLKGVQYLRTARQKAIALKEIIKGNELLKTKISTEALQTFKEAHNNQAPATKTLVTELKV